MSTDFEIMLPDGNGGFVGGRPKTSLDQIEGMTSYMKTLAQTATDAASIQSSIGVSGGGSGGGGGVLPHITVSAPTGCTITCTNGSTTLTTTEDNGTYEFEVPRLGNWTLNCSKTVDGVQRSADKVVNVATVQNYSVSMSYGYQYGFRIRKGESSPAGGVEYILDAVGKEPAHMNFTTGIFDYGDWGDAWFVTDNKPCMLKNNGQVDYYLNPNDYTKTEDGLDSDVSNTAYAGNAMAQLPLCWIKRYEDENYWYTIVSDVQIDSSYKAYAHTRADGSIADYVYYSMFRGSGNATKIRSLAGQTLAQSLTAANEIAGATANGSLWYTHTWGQYQLLTALLVLMGKSRDTQAVFGTGNLRSASAASGMLQTGTLKTMGQFYGYNDSTHQVKVFHIEAPWGDQWDRLAGLIVNSYKVYAKMTREDLGYRITDVNGYEDTGVTLGSLSASYITQIKCSEHGMIPTVGGGASTTYFCCPAWTTSGLTYLLVGGSANNAAANGGSFTFNANNAPSNTNWNNGCGLSYLKRICFQFFNALHNPHPLVKISRYRAGVVSGFAA